MKQAIGIMLIVAGVVCGLYVGGYLMLVGGIVQIIEAVRAPQLISMDVALGVARIMFAGVAAWIAAAVFIAPGCVLVSRR